MEDTHFTSPLDRDPHRQYRVGVLDREDIGEVIAELKVVARVAVQREDSLHQFLDCGGKVAVAWLPTAVEAGYGPADMQVEAVVFKGSTSEPIVYPRSSETPPELTGYLQQYVGTQRPIKGPVLGRAGSSLYGDI